MSKLIDLQQAFQDYLLRGKPTIKKHISNRDHVSTTDRLDIYKNAYFIRLEEALAHNFPLLKTYLGSEQFNELTQAYCARHPSIHRSIRWFGDQLENFLIQDAYYCAFPYLAEMAKFEWTMTLVFDAEDCGALQIEDIARILPEDWQDMRLLLHPSVYLLHFHWNIPAICESLLQEHEPDEPVRAKTAVTWIFWRKDFISRFGSLHTEEAWALDALMSGASFGELGEGLCQWFDEDQAGIQAASLLKGWLEQDLIIKVII